MENDSETKPIADRLQAIAFRKARDADAYFITTSWVTNILNRTTRLVFRNWNKEPMDCFTDFSACV
jgi:hypothetical protein